MGIRVAVPCMGLACREVIAKPSYSAYNERVTSQSLFMSPGYLTWDEPHTIHPLLRDRGLEYNLMGARISPAGLLRTLPSSTLISEPQHEIAHPQY